MGGYAAYQEDGWGGKLGGFGQSGDGGVEELLIGMSGFGDYGAGEIGGEAGVLEPAGEFGVVGAGHVDDEGGGAGIMEHGSG